jgi:hypothetical protein
LAACNNKTNSESSVDSTSTEQSVTDVSGSAVISFERSEYDFGTVNAGEKVSYDYKFTNTGKTPLIISQAVASCGCTVPEYPKEPISPGMSGVIKVVFDSAGKFGKQNKAITITSNAVPANSTLYLNGEVRELKSTKQANDTKIN